MSRITVAIPTYNRGAILVETLQRLLSAEVRPVEMIVVDQTAEHDPATHERLRAWSRDGSIRWIRLPEPSIPHAMNEALRLSTTPLVLFLDDDVIPSAELIAGHENAYAGDTWAVVGQVLQPGESPRHFDDARLHRGALRDLEFPFHHDTALDIENAIACNLSVDRTRALAIGGFDENFIGAAYRFESDFARRVVAAGGRIRFEPRAPVLHLRIPTGGVRAHGDPRKTAASTHSVGDYYFALLHVGRFRAYALRRFRQNVFTRYTLRHPLTIPRKVVAELRGLLQARRLAKEGPRLVRS